MDSAELKKVRASEKPRNEETPRESSSPTPPPISRARVPREDEDENGPVSVPRSDQFIVSSKKPTGTPQSFKPMNPPAAGRLGQTSTTPQAFKPMGPLSQPRQPQQTAPSSFKPMQPQSRAPSGRPSPSPRPPMATAPSSFKPMQSPMQQKAAKTTGAWSDEASTGQRRKPVTIDAVGDAATRIARTTRQTSPKVIASSATIASAPLDSRSAFVLSLVDGTSSVPAIVDASGLAEDEVIGILARLTRLGLISVP